MVYFLPDKSKKHIVLLESLQENRAIQNAGLAVRRFTELCLDKKGYSSTFAAIAGSMSMYSELSLLVL